MKNFTKLKKGSANGLLPKCTKALAALLLLLAVAPWTSLKAQERTYAYSPGSSPSTSLWSTHHSPYGLPSAEECNDCWSYQYVVYRYPANKVNWTGNITDIAFYPDVSCSVTDGRRYTIYMKDMPSGSALAWGTSFSEYISGATTVLSNTTVPTVTGETWNNVGLTGSYAHYSGNDLYVMIKITGINAGGEPSVCVVSQNTSGPSSSTGNDGFDVWHNNRAYSDENGSGELCAQVPYIRFNYGTAYSVTIKPNNTSYGKVRFGSSGSYTAGTLVQAVASGGSVTIGAQANSGYSFTNWTGSSSYTSSNATNTITNITSNRIYTANFTSGGGGGGDTPSGNSGCEYTITLTDAYGDGGGSILVKAGSTTKATYTLSDGSSETFTFYPSDYSLSNGTTLNFVYQSTDQWSYENGYTIKVDGTTIATHTGCEDSGGCTAPTDGSTVASATVACTAATYTVTIARNNTSYGTVSQSSITNVSSGTSVSTSGNKLYVGSTTVTATPASQTAQYTYSFDSWSNASGTITGNRTITANFSRSTRSYTVTASKGTGISTAYVNAGTSASGTSTTATVNYNSSATFKATVSTGYTFDGWYNGNTRVSTSLTYTTTITSALTLTAKATINSYAISVSANPTAGGTVSGGGTYNYNSSCTVSATVNTGYTFNGWYEGSTQVSTSQNYTFTVTAARTLEARYTLNSYAISVSANPTAGGTVSGGGTYNHGSSCTVSATVNTGYTFNGWYEGSTQVSTSQNYTFTVTGARTLEARYTLNSYAISVSANPTAGGTVSGGGTYNHGSSCTVSATVNTGYTFNGWYENNSLVSSSASYNFTVTGARTLEARYTLNSYTITASADPTEGGTIAGAGSYDYGTTCTLTATAAEHYTFVNWTEGGTQVSTDAAYSFTVTGDRTLVANFSQNCLAPTGLYSSTHSITSVTLCWTPGIDETEWQVEYWVAPNGTHVTVTPNVTTTPECTITGLEQGTRYKFRVRAVCSAATYSDWSAEIDETPRRKEFTNNGGMGNNHWEVANNWVPAGAPTADEEVLISAVAEIHDGIIGTAKKIEMNTSANGGIVIKDGGQLKHDGAIGALTIDVTMEKLITGYGDNAYGALGRPNGYHLFSTPVMDRNPQQYTGLLTAPYDFYYFQYNNYDPGDDSDPKLLEWMHVDNNEFLEVGRGYIYANLNDVTIQVTGPVEHSNRTVDYTLEYPDPEWGESPEDYRFSGWNLVGNPFCCNAFVTSKDMNTGNNIDLNYYTLVTANDGYNEFIAADESLPIDPLSAFMVQATDLNQKVVFTREQPTGAKSGILNMNLSAANHRGACIDRARLRFGEGRNMEKIQFDPNHTKIYIPVENKDYAVVYSEAAGIVPVSFEAENNGSYTVSFTNEAVNFNYLHLIDNMTGDDVDLLETPYYTFNAKTTDYATRFKLVFATGDNANSDTFAFFSNGSWVINNAGEATLQVVDVTGRILSSETVNGSCTKAVNAAPGVYMLRLVNGNDVKVQKIVVR